jgi:hypothetical protein
LYHSLSPKEYNFCLKPGFIASPCCLTGQHTSALPQAVEAQVTGREDKHIK